MEETSSFDFWTAVNAKTAAESGSIKNTVVDHYAHKEIASRVDKTIAAVEALTRLKDMFKKIRADQENYDDAGKLMSATYSKAKTEDRKKLLAKMEPIETALRDVFERAEFEKLKKLNLENKQGGAEEKPDASA